MTTNNLPAAFASGPVAELKQAATGSLADGIGRAYGIIGYRGKTWSLRVSGDDMNILRSDGSPSGVIDVIILRSAPLKSKSYYEKYVPGQSEGKPPLCSSIDGILPDEGVIAKQAEACALCPRNEWKRNADGRNGRDCADYKRLAVLMMPEYTAPLMGGKPHMEPVFLRVPPASLNALAKFGDEMEGRGFPFTTFVTRIMFDPDKSHPEFKFSAVRPVAREEAPVVLEMINDTVTKRITGEDQVHRPAAIAARPAAPALPPPVTVAPAPQVATQPVAAAPVAQPAPQPQPAPAAPISLAAAWATKSAEPVSVPAQPAPVVAPVSAPVAPLVQPAPQTPADVGQVAVASESLDDRVARLLKTA